MPPTIEISPERILRYRTAAESRRQQENPEIEQRREKAWKAARLAAQLLKDQFGVSRVVVFGSLVRENGFTRWSDVDVAAWDIAPEDTFRAMGVIMDLGAEVALNLVDVNTVRPALLTMINQDGIDL